MQQTKIFILYFIGKKLEKLQIKNFLTKKMVLENVEVILKTPDLKRKENSVVKTQILLRRNLIVVVINLEKTMINLGKRMINLEKRRIPVQKILEQKEISKIGQLKLNLKCQ